MGYPRETNCSPFAPTKLHYRTEESSPRSLEPFEPTTHSSSHIKFQSLSVQTDHQIGTCVHAPQRPMVTCIMMGTVVPGLHGLL
ncbi:hypothetical protein TNCV_5032421 [Trichonephila clavipes]|nr:hypothetical protein TNCV_5032421 [Trichonephila clavipes]